MLVPRKQYQIGSFKVLRAGLNCYFKDEKGIDIVNDPEFMKANVIFESVPSSSKEGWKRNNKIYPPDQ